MNLRSLRESISGSEHPPLRLLASIPARLTRSAASKLGSHEGAISVGSIEYEMRGRVVYISGTSGHHVHSRDIASIFSCNYVTKYTRLSRSVCIIESPHPPPSLFYITQNFLGDVKYHTGSSVLIAVLLYCITVYIIYYRILRIIRP